MTITKIRALLKAAGYKSTVEIDRFDVKRTIDRIVSVDVMFTDGNVASLPVDA